MSGKKPVWVDENAHAILKEYAQITKESMVDVASALVLQHLQSLSPEAGLPAETESRGGGETSLASSNEMRAFAARPRKAAPARPRPVDGPDARVRYVGGIWVV